MKSIWEQDPERFDLLTEKGAADQANLLPPGLRELIYVAVDLQVAHLFQDGAEVHMVAALDAGVTDSEIIEVLEIAASTVYDSFRVGIPVVLEVFEVSPPPMPPEQTDLRDRYIERYGWWPDGLDLALRVRPELIRQLIRFVSLPDRPPTLDPKWRALILVALYASPPLSDVEAVTQYVRRCRDLGASMQEVVDAIYCGAGIGFHSFTHGYPALEEARRSKEPSGDRPG